MALRIVNETGVGHQTKIFDTETGEELTTKLHVTDISLRLSVNEVVTALISAYPQKLDITLQEAQIRRVCPYCGHETEETLRSADDLKEE